MFDRINLHFLGPFGVNFERSQAVDFSYPILIDYLSIIFPIELGKDPWPIIRPYHWKVWIGILLSPPVFILTMGVADRWANNGDWRRVRWATITGFALRTCFIQSAPWLPESRLYRKMFSLGWMWAFFVIAQGFAGI